MVLRDQIRQFGNTFPYKHIMDMQDRTMAYSYCCTVQRVYITTIHAHVEDNDDKYIMHTHAYTCNSNTLTTCSTLQPCLRINGSVKSGGSGQV